MATRTSSPERVGDESRDTSGRRREASGALTSVAPSNPPPASAARRPARQRPVAERSGLGDGQQRTNRRVLRRQVSHGGEFAGKKAPRRTPPMVDASAIRQRHASVGRSLNDRSDVALQARNTGLSEGDQGQRRQDGALNIKDDAFHPGWHYTIWPSTPPKPSSSGVALVRRPALNR